MPSRVTCAVEGDATQVVDLFGLLDDFSLMFEVLSLAGADPSSTGWIMTIAPPRFRWTPRAATIASSRRHDDAAGRCGWTGALCSSRRFRGDVVPSATPNRRLDHLRISPGARRKLAPRSGQSREHDRLGGRHRSCSASNPPAAVARGSRIEPLLVVMFIPLSLHTSRISLTNLQASRRHNGA